MITIKRLLEEGAILLKQSNIDSYRVDSRVLLSKVLKLPQEEIILSYDGEVSNNTQEEFFKLVARRQKKEPISYITGIKEFYSMDFFVDQNVLIPRPDSESLVEGVLQNIEKDKKVKILELGSGSGCLILTILKYMKNASGVAVDIKEGALKVAKKNYQNLKLNNKIEFIKSDWNDLKIDGEFDIIISNPPYIKSQDLHDLQEDVREYEPNIALEAGEDGLDAYRSLGPIIRRHLKESGLVFLEFGEGQGDYVKDIMLEYGLSSQKIIKDLSHKDRCMLFKRLAIR
jgi:release factor glutamine methyltransferase